MLTPFGSPRDRSRAPRDGGGLARVIGLARAPRRTAAREAQIEAGNGKHTGRRERLRRWAGAARGATVPPGVRELADSLTAFGTVAPTLLRDRAGALSACLFLPTSLDALPLARFARDLHARPRGHRESAGSHPSS